MTTLTKLPQFHTGTDTHNLPGNRCEIDWAVLTTLAATTAGQTLEEKAVGVYQLLCGAADVAKEMHDFEACSRLASHAIVALNWIPRFDDVDAEPQVNEDILSILASGEGRMPNLILWLRDHFKTPQPN